jgi:exonuclease SbcD
MKILHFADLHLGVESYGHLDPESGLSSRFFDFLSTLDQLVDYAQEFKVDLVLFCGDAYKSREPSQTQQREFAKRINHLSTRGIPVFLLTGNHDLPNAIGRATATEIFGTLAIEKVYVSNHPDIYHIPTASGDIQIVTLPWLRRSTLLSKEGNKNLNFEQINQRLQEILTNIITASIPKLNPSLPSILAGHVWVATAQLGSEKSMTIGQEHVLLLSNVANHAFDYIALGHIHKHQILCDSPPVAYAGSLERLDFGDEEDEKGFYIVEITPEQESNKRRVSFDFHSVTARQFHTVNINITGEDTNPTSTVLKAIAKEEKKIKDAIIRLDISLPAEIEGHLRDSDIKAAVKKAHHLTIAKEISHETRLRLGNHTVEELTPLDALEAYLALKKTSPKRIKMLLKYGRKLIEEEGINKDTT